MGNGLYIKIEGCVCKVETDGKRLLFEPAYGKVLAMVMVYIRKGKVNYTMVVDYS